MKKDSINDISSYKDYKEEVILWCMIIGVGFLKNDYFYKNCRFETPTYSYFEFLKYTFSLYKSSNIGYIIFATLLLPFRLICCVLAPFLPILGLGLHLVFLFVYIIFSIAYLPEKYLDKKLKKNVNKIV